MTGTLVIVPTYNEGANIRHSLDEIRAWLPDADVLVVDDGSPDGTGVLADEYAAQDAAVTVLHRHAKEGLGAAYRAGFDYALDHDYTSIIEMDADGSHRAESLPALVAGLERSDLVLGSRWVDGGRTEGWPWTRICLSRGASWYARWALDSSTRDMTSGYRAFRASTLRAIGVGRTVTNGYCFQVETLYLTERAGLAVSEVPILFTERVSGHSKMSVRIIVEALVQIARWGWRDRHVTSDEHGGSFVDGSPTTAVAHRSR